MDDAALSRSAGLSGGGRVDLGRNGAAHPQKKGLNPSLIKRWSLATAGPDFVWRMEDVLALYAEAYDPDRPLICIDEYSLALTAAVHPAIPARLGRARREDYEYQRRGSAQLLGSFQPATGWRQIEVTLQRTKVEFAEQMRQLAEEHFPEADTIRVVCDNLNTHTPAAYYEVFPAQQARRLAERIELHYTPKHGSWLNMIEVEWAVLKGQCLQRHVPDRAMLAREVAVWAAERNARHGTVDWRFTIPDARRRLARLYPWPTAQCVLANLP